MGTITLDDRDQAVLERLREEPADVDSLAERTGLDPEYLRERLSDLEDNGLVARVESGAYALTEDGVRTIEATSVGAKDDRIDTPPAVEARIADFDLRPDREAAVRNAFSFLRYWGEAFESELVDGVYSETPAGFESEREWWTECVRDRLADLPSVEPPGEEDQPWRYAGTPTVEKRTADGRVASGTDVTDRSSVKFALERLDADDEERAAVRAVFEFLQERVACSAADLRREVYPDNDAGYGSPSEWWNDCVRPALESLPGVERTDDGWRYRSSEGGPMPSDSNADVPDGPSGPDDGA